jgi:hypothetical protein
VESIKLDPRSCDLSSESGQHVHDPESTGAMQRSASIASLTTREGAIRIRLGHDGRSRHWAPGAGDRPAVDIEVGGLAWLARPTRGSRRRQAGAGPAGWYDPAPPQTRFRLLNQTLSLILMA